MRSLRPPRRTVVVGVTAVVILAAAGIGAYAATGSGGAHYRTAKVTSATVADTLSETATAEPETSATASYAGSGTVDTVTVKSGQTVTAGQVLATLDTTSLEVSLAEAKATTAQAQLALANAENGEITAATGGSSTGSGGSSSGGGSFSGSTTAATSGSSVSTANATAATTAHALLAAAPGPTGGAPTGGSGAGGSGSGGTATSISGLQKQVTGGQQKVDAALATAKTQLADAQKACAATGSGAPTGTPTGSPTAAPTATATESPTTATTDSPTASPTASPTSTAPTTGAGSAACLSAETALLQTQTQLASDESSLSSALVALDTALDKAIAAEQATTKTTTSGSGGYSGTGSTGGSSTGGSSSKSGSTSTSSTPTAAQLAAYQAKVDAATAAQAVAQQTYDMSTLRSPISGTVESVGLTAGGSSSAGSIVIANPDAYVLTTTVSVTDVPKVKAGEQVSVKPDGSDATITGTVVRVGVAPDSDGDYAVTIGVDGVPQDVRSGSTAAVTITLSTSSGGLTIPTSAIVTANSLKVVRVLKNGKITTVPVTVTTSGAVLSEVTATGLAVGDEVVLADLSEAVPASNSSTTTTSTSGLGGLSFGGTTTGGGATGGFPGGGGAGGFGGR